MRNNRVRINQVGINQIRINRVRINQFRINRFRINRVRINRMRNNKWVWKAWNSKSATENLFFRVELWVIGGVRPGTGDPPPQINFWWRLQVRGCSWPETQKPPPKIWFSGQTTSYSLQQAPNSKSATENLFLVVDFKSEGAAGPQLKSHPGKSFFWLGLQVIGCAVPRTWNPPPKTNFWWQTSSPRVQLAQNFEIHPQKSSFLVGLQVVGCSGPGTRNPPLKIFFLGHTMSYKVHQAWDSKSTTENEILVADFKSRAAVGLELEICHRKSFFRVGLWVIGCIGPGTRNPPLRTNFWWGTSSPRVQLAWNLKATPENNFFGSDYEL